MSLGESSHIRSSEGVLRRDISNSKLPGSADRLDLGTWRQIFFPEANQGSLVERKIQEHQNFADLQKTVEKYIKDVQTLRKDHEKAYAYYKTHKDNPDTQTIDDYNFYVKHFNARLKLFTDKLNAITVDIKNYNALQPPEKSKAQVPELPKKLEPLKQKESDNKSSRTVWYSQLPSLRKLAKWGLTLGMAMATIDQAHAVKIQNDCPTESTLSIYQTNAKINETVCFIDSPLSIPRCDRSLEPMANGMYEQFNEVVPPLGKRFAANPCDEKYKDIELLVDAAYEGVAKIGGGMQIIFNPEYGLNPNDFKGILTHELMHLFQDYPQSMRNYFSFLEEGIADYARHTYGPEGDKWSLPDLEPEDYNYYKGYYKGYGTTARFLVWLEQKGCPEIVDNLNRLLQNNTHILTTHFKEWTGQEPRDLWEEYCRDKEWVPLAKRPSEAFSSNVKTKDSAFIKVSVGALIVGGIIASIGISLKRAYQERMEIDKFKEIKMKIENSGSSSLTEEERKQIIDIIEKRRNKDRKRLAELNKKPKAQRTDSERSEMNDIRVRKELGKLLRVKHG